MGRIGCSVDTFEGWPPGLFTSTTGERIDGTTGPGSSGVTILRTCARWYTVGDSRRTDGCIPFNSSRAELSGPVGWY